MNRGTTYEQFDEGCYAEDEEDEDEYYDAMASYYEAEIEEPCCGAMELVGNDEEEDNSVCYGPEPEPQDDVYYGPEPESQGDVYCGPEPAPQQYVEDLDAILPDPVEEDLGWLTEEVPRCQPFNFDAYRGLRKPDWHPRRRVRASYARAHEAVGGTPTGKQTLPTWDKDIPEGDVIRRIDYSLRTTPPPKPRNPARYVKKRFKEGIAKLGLRSNQPVQPSSAYCKSCGSKPVCGGSRIVDPTERVRMSRHRVQYEPRISPYRPRTPLEHPMWARASLAQRCYMANPTLPYTP